MNIKIPEKYREEFDRSAEFAIESEKFTLKELAQALEMGELAASIMIGYMEKTGLVTKGKLDDVRRARISLEEWEKIDKKIENYQPLPEDSEESFHAEIKEEVLSVEDVILPGTKLYKTEIIAKDAFIILKSAVEYALPLESVTSLALVKPGFFKQGKLVFFLENARDDSEICCVAFKKKDFERAKNVAFSIAEKLKIQVK